jgi:hypothetical protein
MEGNFAAQMKQAMAPENRNPQAPPAEAPKAVTAATGPDSMGLMGPMGDMELPMGGQPEPTPVEPAPEVKPPAKIKIKGREFDSMEAAYDFVSQEQARLEGKEEVLNKLQQPKEEAKADDPPPTPWEKELADEFFRDPESALRKMYQKAKEDSKKEVFERYNEMTAEQARTQQLETQLKQTWDGFYEQNKDLSSDRDIVDYIVEKNWAEVKDLPSSQSLPIIAEKTRQFLRRNRENSLPQTELSNGPALMAQGSSTFRGGQGVPVSTQEKQLDMISQIRKLDKRIKA